MRTGERRGRLTALAASVLLALACLMPTALKASVPRGTDQARGEPPRIASLAPPDDLSFQLLAGDELGRALDQVDGSSRFTLGVAPEELDARVLALVSRVREIGFHPLQGLDLIDAEPLRGPPEREPKTRIGGLELFEPFAQREEPRLTLGLQWRCGPGSCEIASGQRFDPLGLMEMTPQAKRDLALMTADLARYRQAQSGAVIPSLRVRTVDRLTIGGDDLPEVTRQGYELSEAPEEVMHGMATSGTVQVSLDGSVSRATRVDSFVDAWDRAKPLDHVYYDEGSERFLLWSREEWQKQVDEQVQFSWKQNAATAIAAKFTASGAARARKNKGSSGKGTSGGTGYLRGGMIDENYEPNRKAVIKRDPSCQYCQTRPSTTADHVVPVYDADAVVGAGLMTREQARAAVNELENLLGACLSCNSSKKNSLPGNVPGTWQPSNPSPRAIEVMKQLGSWQ